MTNEELLQIINAQEERIVKLEYELSTLRKWSDLNDYWLRQMIDSLTECVDKLLGIDHTGEI